MGYNGSLHTRAELCPLFCLRNSICETTCLTNEIVCFEGRKYSGSSRWGPTGASAPVTLSLDSPPHLYLFLYVLFYVSCLCVISSPCFDRLVSFTCP